MDNVKITIGDRVITIKNNQIRKGTVTKIYDLDPIIYIVEFDDGNVEKVCHNEIALEPETETQEEDLEPVEKSEITITPDEFKKIACRVIVNETKDSRLMGLVFALLMDKIHKALFVEPWEND